MKPPNIFVSESSKQVIGLLGSLRIEKWGRVVPGFSFADNTILVWKDGKNELRQFKFEHGKFSETKIIYVPKEWSNVTYQYTLSSGIKYMSYINLLQTAMLNIYDKDFNRTKEYSSEGLLIGVVDNLKLLIFDNIHALGGEGTSNQIIVKSMQDLSVVRHLSVEHRYTRHDLARACGHPTDGRIALVFKTIFWLDVFRANGKTIFIVQIRRGS